MRDLPEIPITRETWLTLSERYMPTIAATLPLPGFYPTELNDLGICGRNPLYNTLLGTTVTVPSVNLLALGIAWDDLRGGHTDEEMIVADGVKLVIRRYHHGAFERVDPRYAGHFRGPKNYFRLPGLGSAIVLPDLP